MKFIIGVDEAGRGPLAGPVAVGVVSVPKGFNWKQIPEVNDSKQLSEQKREEIFTLAKKLQKEGKLEYLVSMVSASVIDRIGIVPSVNRAMGRALARLDPSPEHCSVKLDGSLHAPLAYTHQETIVKGDSKEKVIGLASIMAKVTRDRYMVKLCKDYPFTKYGFDIHKGYGTKAHRDAIKKYGVSKLHRRTFCKNIAQ